MKQGIILLFAVCMSMTAMAHKTDSVGTKMKNGKMYILHKVEKGDGLYNISKRYNVSLKEIIVENPGSDEVIKLGQIILIPSNMEPVMEEKVVKDFFDGSSLPKGDTDKSEHLGTMEVSTFAKYHKVALGETLYAISKKYNTSVEMIKTLNVLKNNEVTEGQRLLVQDGSAKTETVDKSLEVETDYTKMKEEMAVQKYENLGYDTPVISKEPETINGYTVRVEKLVEYNIEKVEEEGTTGVGTALVPSDKNFAVHFSAPIGTVIMVTNPENKNTVFVKVTGNFEIKKGSSEIIKLSESSARQIEITDKSRVLLSYAR
ncbi:LysM peptidoglycan-binding domain-containing protein [Bacteroidia bacterium]|nr:LysM peptidoglycan-binding domain-containing protein [Bacteroidia bacterium]